MVWFVFPVKAALVVTGPTAGGLHAAAAALLQREANFELVGVRGQGYDLGVAGSIVALLL